MPVVCDNVKCIGCGSCRLICPQDAMKGDFICVNPVEIDEDKCNSCLECLDMCPVEALKEV